MKIAVIVTIATIASVLAQAGENVHATERGVSVCIEGGAGWGVKTHAEAIASKMFAGIGVTAAWREGLRDCPRQGILISLTDRTPAGFIPGALGRALPYEGAHIRLFYDRIAQDRSPVLVAALLAHVMAHEISHVLQGMCEHSSQGIMKAQWTEDDFRCMIRKPLAFTDEDVDRIYRGLAARAARLTEGEQLSAGL